VAAINPFPSPWPRQTSHALVQLKTKSNSLHFVIKRSKVSVTARWDAFLRWKHNDRQFYTFCCWSRLLLSLLLLHSYLSCSECPSAVPACIRLHSETDHSEHRFHEVSRRADNWLVFLLTRNTVVNVIENLSSVKTLRLWNLQLAQNVLRAWKSLKSQLSRHLECRLKKLWEKCDFVSTKTHVLQPVPVSSSLCAVNVWCSMSLVLYLPDCYWSALNVNTFCGALHVQSCCICWNLPLVNKNLKSVVVVWLLMSVFVSRNCSEQNDCKGVLWQEQAQRPVCSCCNCWSCTQFYAWSSNPKGLYTRNSSGDEIPNVIFLCNGIVHALKIQ